MESVAEMQSSATTVVIALRQCDPALLPLARDVGLADFALRLQRIKGLRQSFFRRFPRVDGTICDGHDYSFFEWVGVAR